MGNQSTYETVIFVPYRPTASCVYNVSETVYKVANVVFRKTMCSDQQS